MAANRNRRLVKEIQDVQKDSHSGVSLEPLNKAQTGSDTLDDLTHFKGVFRGPPDTPYHGATYHVDIKIPNDYPFQPPVMKFTTKIWHPNISSVTVRPSATSALHHLLLTWCSGCHLSRYSGLGLVTSPYPQVRSHFPPVATILA